MSMAPITIRFPQEIKDEIQEIAQKEGRSFNSQIVQVIKEYLKSRASPCPFCRAVFVKNFFGFDIYVHDPDCLWISETQGK